MNYDLSVLVMFIPMKSYFYGICGHKDKANKCHIHDSAGN